MTVSLSTSHEMGSWFLPGYLGETWSAISYDSDWEMEARDIHVSSSRGGDDSDIAGCDCASRSTHKCSTCYGNGWERLGWGVWQIVGSGASLDGYTRWIGEADMVAWAVYCTSDYRCGSTAACMCLYLSYDRHSVVPRLLQEQGISQMVTFIGVLWCLRCYVMG